MTSPTRQGIEDRLHRLDPSADTNYDEAAYYRWFRRCLRGEVDHGRETPPAGLDAWFETSAGQAAIGRSVTELRAARRLLKEQIDG